MNRIILLLIAQLFFQSEIFADHSFQEWIAQTEEASLALLQKRTLKEKQYLKLVEQTHRMYQSNATFSNYIKYQDAKALKYTTIKFHRTTLEISVLILNSS